MNESSHQKRYKSSSTSMSMALAEASIQSLLDFLRLNLWIWFDGFHKRGSLDKWKGRGGEGGKVGKNWEWRRMFFFSSSPTCMNPCTSITVLFWQAKKAKLGILLGFYLTNALECFAICHFATENPRITPTTKERSNHYTSSTQNA